MPKMPKVPKMPKILVSLRSVDFKNLKRQNALTLVRLAFWRIRHFSSF
jgi:hypothetical protein